MMHGSRDELIHAAYTGTWYKSQLKCNVWLKLQYCAKVLSQPLIYFYFASKEPDFSLCVCESFNRFFTSSLSQKTRLFAKLPKITQFHRHKRVVYDSCRSKKLTREDEQYLKDVFLRNRKKIQHKLDTGPERAILLFSRYIYYSLKFQQKWKSAVMKLFLR